MNKISLMFYFFCCNSFYGVDVQAFFATQLLRSEICQCGRTVRRVLVPQFGVPRSEIEKRLYAEQKKEIKRSVERNLSILPEVKQMTVCALRKEQHKLVDSLDAAYPDIDLFLNLTSSLEEKINCTTDINRQIQLTRELIVRQRRL